MGNFQVKLFGAGGFEKIVGQVAELEKTIYYMTYLNSPRPRGSDKAHDTDRMKRLSI